MGDNMNDDAAIDRYLDDQHEIVMRRAALEAEIRKMEQQAEFRYRNGGKDLTPSKPAQPKPNSESWFNSLGAKR